MAELTTQDRLQPSLLDRLIDHEPQQMQESRDKRVLSLKKLREAVARDVGWLLNSSHYSPQHDLDQYPNARQSVLNFGMPDLTGRTVHGLDLAQKERELRQTLWCFEPRLIRETLKVQIRTSDKKMCRNAFSIELEAQLWAEPAPLQLYMKTEIDLESGEVKVVDMH
jgi:type VI secretion system protein ImpF